MRGMKRHYLSLLDELLGLFPCVALIGVRQCGKTTLLNQYAKSWRLYDLEKAGDMELISRDPDLFFRLNPKQVAIDEAQMLPEIFPALRVAIDADRNRTGSFIITGSSSPELLKSISESLAGRIAIIEMAPFSMTEAFALPISPFYQLLTGSRSLQDYQELKPQGTLQDLHRYWFAGGYPEPWLKENDRFRKLWMQNYIQTYLERDILRLFPGLDRQKYRLFLQMLSNFSGSIINYSDVARTLGVSQPTAREYFQIAHGTFVWRHIPPYEKNGTKRTVKHPKGYIRDTGLLHYLLHLRKIDDLLLHPGMGNSWESLIIENILRNLNALGTPHACYYYRTGGGAEVDLILEGDFGLLPIDIKYSQRITLKELRGIRDFIRERNCSYGIVVTNSEKVEFLEEKLIAIPASCI